MSPKTYKYVDPKIFNLEFRHCWFNQAPKLFLYRNLFSYLNLCMPKALIQFRCLSQIDHIKIGTAFMFDVNLVVFEAINYSYKQYC